MKKRVDKPGTKAMRLYMESSEAFSKWVNGTFDIKKQERWYEKRKNETRAEQALRRLLTHFVGDWPEIVVKRVCSGNAHSWTSSPVDDQTRDDVLFARRIMEKGVT